MPYSIKYWFKKDWLNEWKRFSFNKLTQWWCRNYFWGLASLPKPGILLTPSPLSLPEVILKGPAFTTINKCVPLGKWYNGLTFWKGSFISSEPRFYGHYAWTQALQGAVLDRQDLAPLNHHRATARSTYTQGGPAYIKQDSQTSTIWWLILVSAQKVPYTRLYQSMHFICLLQKGEKNVCVYMCECICPSNDWGITKWTSIGNWLILWTGFVQGMETSWQEEEFFLHNSKHVYFMRGEANQKFAVSPWSFSSYKK